VLLWQTGAGATIVLLENAANENRNATGLLLRLPDAAWPLVLLPLGVQKASDPGARTMRMIVHYASWAVARRVRARLTSNPVVTRMVT